MSHPIGKPDKSNGLEFRFDLPFSCQASAKTLLHLVLFSSMCRLIPYLVPGGPSANTEPASDLQTGGFIRFFRRCSQPAMNTPQFGWVKSRLPKMAQPVPPIYQP